MKSDEKEPGRYQRQMLIDGWGQEGQKKLRSATVFVAGAGGLGCPAAIFLVSAGVGRIRLCDCSEVCLTNLNRQVLYSEGDIGRQKVFAAREALLKLNPHVDVEPLRARITSKTVADLVGESSLVLDCLDNFDTRHVLNDYAVHSGIPFIHAGIEGLSGQVTFIHTPETPCLYCLFPGAIPAKDVFPVAGVTPGVVGTIQACEAIKWIVGIGENLKGKLLFWDGEIMQFQKITVARDPDCPVCGKQ